jgi:two-component system phosphate regulon response regulator PhoB
MGYAEPFARRAGALRILFSPSEMITRVRAVLRRSYPGLAEGVLRFADVAMNRDTHRVKRNGSLVELSPTGFSLLAGLLERPRHVFSREALLNRVWGRDADLELRTVGAHIGRVRKSLNAGGKKDIIRMVRGSGYALDAQGD